MVGQAFGDQQLQITWGVKGHKMDRFTSNKWADVSAFVCGRGRIDNLLFGGIFLILFWGSFNLSAFLK